jgi:hypothetical protein
MGVPLLSIKHLYSLVCRAPILRGVNSEDCLLYDMVADEKEEPVERCRAIASDRNEAIVEEEEWWRGEKIDFSVGLEGARFNGEVRER